MHDSKRRNKAMCERFYTALGKGMPIMQAYANVGEEFYLSEERVRKIIAQKHKWLK